MGNNEFCMREVTLRKWEDALALANELSQIPKTEAKIEH